MAILLCSFQERHWTFQKYFVIVPVLSPATLSVTCTVYIHTMRVWRPFKTKKYPLVAGTGCPKDWYENEWELCSGCCSSFVHTFVKKSTKSLD